MPVISAEILKIIDERERCDTRCVVIRTVKDADNVSKI